MSQQNKVEVLLTAKDEISGKLSGLVAGFTATLAGLAITGLAVGNLGHGLKEAASVQTSMIGSAGDVATLMGVSYGKATSIVKDNMKEISKMAAALPGETAGYAAIANAVTATLALGSKGNVEAFKKDLMDVTKTMGMLAATKGVDMNQAAAASNKLIAGTTNLSELFATNDVFQKNPLFRVYLDEQLKLIGKQESDWRNLSQEVRTRAFDAAGKRSFSKEMLDDLSRSSESMMAGIKTQLFDPQVGIFGFLREIKGLNNRTTLETVATALQAVNYLSESATKLLAKHGIHFDPMEIVGKGFDLLTETMNAVNMALTSGSLDGLKNLFRGLNVDLKTLNFKVSIKAIGDVFNVAVEGFKRIDFKGIIGGIGDIFNAMYQGFMSIDAGAVAKGFNSIVDTLMNALNGVSSAGVGNSLSGAMGGIMGKIDQLFAAIDWVKLGKLLDSAITKMFEALGRLIFNFGKGQVDGAVKYFKEDAKKEVNGLQRFTNWAIDGVNGALGGKQKMPNVPIYQERSALPSNMPQPMASLPYIPTSYESNSSNKANTFAPTINVHGATSNLQELTDNVMAAINSKYREYSDGALA